MLLTKYAAYVALATIALLGAMPERISVGPNLQVSAAYALRVHGDVHAAADPNGLAPHLDRWFSSAPGVEDCS